MSTCTAQIGLTPGVNTSVPISGTVSWTDAAGSQVVKVNQPYQGHATTLTLTGVTSVQMTASSPGFISQTKTVTCGQYTQFELTQATPPPPPAKFHSLREFLKYSGVSGTDGIRRLYPAHTQINLRAVMGV